MKNEQKEALEFLVATLNGNNYGLSVESQQKALKLAAQKVENAFLDKSPCCPICQATMEQVNYVGYYDEMSYWQCSCNYFKGVEKTYGSYA